MSRCSREEAIKTVCHACLLLQEEHLQFKGEKLSDVSIAAYHSSSPFHGAAMPEYVLAIEKYLLDNPKLSKPALVELLTKRFSDLSADEAWVIVSRYINR